MADPSDPAVIAAVLVASVGPEAIYGPPGVTADDLALPPAAGGLLIECQTPGCGCAIGGRDLTPGQARAEGWRIYDGQSVAGTPHRAVLCPACIGGEVPGV